MAFYRHFCDRADFQISVITDNAQVQNYSLPYPCTLVKHGRLWQRCARTRFSKAAHSWAHLAGASVSDQVIQQAEAFGAEAVFTVAGSWSWMAKLAGDVAKQLKLPLVGSFNDWWYYSLIRYSWLDGLIEQEFRKFYRRCDLALCTSPGMREALGPHANAIVLYPTGATIEASKSRLNAIANRQDSAQQPFTVAFAGNLGDWYGRMLESLITAAWQSNRQIQFKLFGSNASWSQSFDEEVKAKGIFQGQVPFERLREEMKTVDALLLLMGFEPSCAQIERTSFKTKFLDYLTFQKPILLWGPDYCSAVQIAQEFDSAEVCTSAEADDYLEIIHRLQSDSLRQNQLIEHSQQMYQERFHPDNIHQLLVQKMTALRR